MNKFFTNKKKMTISGIALAVAATTVIGGVTVNANSSMKVDSYKADRGELSSMIEINGKVEADTSKTYYSAVDAKVGNILVKEGDFVKKGDLLVSYDDDNLAKMAALAEYDAKANLGSYNNSVQTGEKAASLYGEAKNQLAALNSQIALTETTILQVQNELAERRANLAHEGAKLQVSLTEYADRPDSKEYENLQKLIQNNAYEQQYGDDIVKLEENLNSLNIQLAALKEYKAEMTSQKASTEMSVMTKGAKEQLEAIKAANELNSEDAIANYKAAADGITADFDGIVTGINVVEGCDVARGTQLVTLKSSSDVIVKLNVNKYDIINIREGQSATVTILNKNYTGKIVRVERMISESGSNTGIGVDVKIDNPGDDIILGIDAKAVVNTSDLDEALRVPGSALWEDEEGTFVFVSKNGKAYKTAVETGTRNDDMVEIVSGINEGETVVWNDKEALTDGMNVKICK